MHHAVINVVSVIVAMLILWYSMMLRVILILFYHASILTLDNFLIFCALWLPQA